MRPIFLSLGRIDLLAGPVFAGLSAAVAYLYFRRYRSHAGLSVEEFWNLMLPLSIAVMASGVVVYFFLYSGGFERNLAYVIERGRIRGGAFYGNLGGAALTLYIFARWRGLSFRRLADLLGGAAPLALSLMRLGCIQHGCCFGKPTSLPWGIVFTHPRCGVRRSWLGTPLHPSQLYEALGCLAIFAVVHFVVFRRIRDGKLPPGSAFLASAVLYGVLRFLLDFVRGSDPGVLRPLGLTTAQLMALATFAGAAYLYRRWRHAPGA
ncbi:MAG: prolipoprotein diacylglyceryl transferase family protein [Elusimicrobiota bacterium]